MKSEVAGSGRDPCVDPSTPQVRSNVVQTDMRGN